jgi:hypothetical protein
MSEPSKCPGDCERERLQAQTAQAWGVFRLESIRLQAERGTLLAACKRAKTILDAIGKHVTWPVDIDFGTPDLTFAVVVGETLAELEAVIAKTESPG